MTRTYICYLVAALSLVGSVGLTGCLATDSGELYGEPIDGDPSVTAESWGEPVGVDQQAIKAPYIIYGSVNADGNTISGSEFTSSMEGRGVYRLMFSVDFVSAPVVVATIRATRHRDGFRDNTIDVQPMADGCMVYTYDIDGANISRPQNSSFDFIAIGVLKTP